MITKVKSLLFTVLADFIFIFYCNNVKIWSNMSCIFDCASYIIFALLECVYSCRESW